MKLDLNKLFIVKLFLYTTLVYFIYLLILITLQYIPINYEVAFLNLKQEEIKLNYYKFSFFGHVFSSMIIIIVGLSQFSNTTRTKFPYLHKFNGKAYIILILILASPTGFVLAIHANGGLISKISFTILSIIWFLFTLKAYLFIKEKKFNEHKEFMIRSYALTLSAVSLRLLKFIIIFLFKLPPMDTYQIVSVLGWTINLGIAEVIIRKARKNIN